MYESSFGLSKNPFALTPDPSLLFTTASYREALAGITYAILKRKGFVILSGDAGTGKTTLLNSIVATMPGRAVFARIVNPTLSASEFLELLLIEFGIPSVSSSKAQRLVQLREFLTRADKESRAAVLVVDEAQTLTPTLLEEIRLLTNFETGSAKLLQVILSGQSEFLSMIDRYELRQLKQRVAVRVHLAPLRPAEVAQYVAYRWMRSGGAEIPFSADALRAVAEGSHGIPRLVNSICDNALMLAFGAVSERVEVHHVLEVLRDLGIVKAAVRGPATAHTPDAGGSKTGITPPVEQPREAVIELAEPPAKPSVSRRLAGKLGLNLSLSKQNEQII